MKTFRIEPTSDTELNARDINISIKSWSKTIGYIIKQSFFPSRLALYPTAEASHVNAGRIKINPRTPIPRTRTTWRCDLQAPGRARRRAPSI